MMALPEGRSLDGGLANALARFLSLVETMLVINARRSSKVGRLLYIYLALQ